MAAAQERVEHDTERVLINQTFESTGNRFPGPTGAIPLHRNPIQSVEKIDYIDADGITQTLNASAYFLNMATRAVYPSIGFTWPEVTQSSQSVIVSFTAGYGTSGDNVPAELLALMLLALDHLFYGIDNLDQYMHLRDRYIRTSYP